MFDFNQAEVELARRRLVPFGHRVFSGFKSPRHVRYLCDLLEQLEAGTIRRLVVSIPPRHSKSSVCSQLFPSWFIGRDPRRNVILASHSQSLADLHSRRCKQFVESDAWPFAGVRLSPDSTSIQRWNVEAGGGMFAIGTGGGITGRGADCLVLDDPLNSGLSPVENQNAWEWFQNVAIPRCNAGARILVVSARLSESDIPGMLAESPDAHEYTFVRLPALAEDNDPLGRAPGEPLWPEEFDQDELNQRREAMGSGPFLAQFQQDASVAAGGKIFRLADFPTWDVLPQPPTRPWDPLDHFYDDPLKKARPEDNSFVKITGCDFAGTDNVSTGGSFSALVTVLLNLANGEVFVTDCERPPRNLDFWQLRNVVCGHLARHSPSLVTIEANDGTGGRMVGDLTRTTRWPIRAVRPKASKVERALSVSGLIESHRVYLPARAIWRDALVAEIAAFGPGARRSDQVDALVWCLLTSRQYIAACREDDFYRQQLEAFSLFGR